MENNFTLEEIKEMWQSGMNAQQISNKTGIKYHRIYLALKKIGLYG